MDRTSVISRSQTNIPLPQPMPIQAYLPMPSVSGISGLGDTSASSALSPTTAVQRLPSIVNPTPTDLGASCDAFTLWVSENPFWALGGLAVIAYFTVLKGKS